MERTGIRMWVIIRHSAKAHRVQAHITSYHGISRHITSYHGTSRHITAYHGISRHVKLYRVSAVWANHNWSSHPRFDLWQHIACSYVEESATRKQEC